MNFDQFWADHLGKPLPYPEPKIGVAVWFTEKNCRYLWDAATKACREQESDAYAQRNGARALVKDLANFLMELEISEPEATKIQISLAERAREMLDEKVEDQQLGFEELISRGQLAREFQRRLTYTTAVLREAWEESEHFSQNVEQKVRRCIDEDPCDCENCIAGAP